MKRVFVLLFVTLSVGYAQADSPVTSTTIFNAYLDVPMVQKANETDGLTDEMLTFLDNKKTPATHKLALINALSWGNPQNLKTYESFLTKKYKLKASFFDSLSTPYLDEAHLMADPFVKKLSGDELMSWSYFKVLDDYFSPIHALKAAMYNINVNDNNGAYLFQAGLVLSQLYMHNGNWCKVYMIMAEVVGNCKKCDNTLRERAVYEAFSYLDVYKESCAEQGMNVANLGDNLFVELAASDFESFSNPKKGARPDLTIQKLNYPEHIVFDESIKGTIITVVIENKGKVSAIPSSLKIETQPEENDDEALSEKQLYEIQYNYAKIVKVPAIPAKSSVEIEVVIPNYWIFDPNCELRMIIDSFNKIEEKKEKNNVLVYFAFG